MIKYKNIGLTKYEEEEISKLLKIKTLEENPLEEMWYLMDYMWDSFECDPSDLKSENISKFYSHPVWLLNGLFIENDDDSMKNRKKIVEYLKENNAQNILDYGGGFGTLARELAKELECEKIDVYEPYPSQFGLKRMNEFSKIKVIKKLEKKYKYLVQTDVLEHVESPLKVLQEMVQSVELNGQLLIGNCFAPCIKCHLPQHYHYNNTFDFFIKKFGLKKIGNLGYIGVYEKIEEKNIKVEDLNFYIQCSKVYYNIKKIIKGIIRR